MCDGEVFIEMAFRTAIMFKTHVFLVDYWKAKNTKAPRGASDFAEAIEYINNNSTKFGIHKDHLCVGGAGFGAWIVLGAMQQLILRKNIDIIDTVFYICPLVNNELSKVDENKLEYWEKKWANYNTGFFELMAKNMKDQNNDMELFPTRGKGASLFKQMPPSVVFTAEFDYCRRDAILLKRMLEKAGKLADFHDMPEVDHLYYFDSTLPQSFWFMKDYTFAFEKYVKKEDKL